MNNKDKNFLLDMSQMRNAQDQDALLKTTLHSRWQSGGGLKMSSWALEERPHRCRERKAHLRQTQMKFWKGPSRVSRMSLWMQSSWGMSYWQRNFEKKLASCADDMVCPHGGDPAVQKFELRDEVFLVQV